MTPMKRIPTSCVALAAVVSLSAPSAWAVDLTGSWEGEVTCEQFQGGVKFKSTEETTMEIHQSADGNLNIDLPFGINDFQYIWRGHPRCGQS